MDDLEKVIFTQNGQWQLAKARGRIDDMSPEEQARLIQAFKDRYAARTPAAPAPRTDTGPRMPLERERMAAQMRPAAINNILTPKPVPRPYRTQDEATPPPPPQPEATPGNGGNDDIVSPEMKRLNTQAARDDEKGAAKLQHSDSWMKTAKFFAEKSPDPKERARWASLLSNMDERKRLNSAHAGGEYLDEQGKPIPARGAPNRTRFDPPSQPGTFHNQSATTNGRVVERLHQYPDPEFPDDPKKMKRARRVQEERHHWRWDHYNKQWNHIGTTYENGDYKAPKTVTPSEPIKPADNRVIVLPDVPGEKAKLVDPSTIPTPQPRSAKLSNVPAVSSAPPPEAAPITATSRGIPMKQQVEVKNRLNGKLNSEGRPPVRPTPKK